MDQTALMKTSMQSDHEDSLGIAGVCKMKSFLLMGSLRQSVLTALMWARVMFLLECHATGEIAGRIWRSFSNLPFKI
jgi:hypothetical protein